MTKAPQELFQLARSAIERAGFVIESCEAFVFRPFPLALPTAPHILGTARPEAHRGCG